MKALPLFILALGLPAVALAAAGLEEVFGGQGRLIMTSLASAPFPHPARAEGHTYQGRLYPAKEHYADSTVALFIPNGFRESERIDLVIHFHGWNNTVARTLTSFHLVEQLVASGKNAVLVIPEGPHDAPDSFGGRLEDADGFRRFIADVMATLNTRAGFKAGNHAAGRIILSGHSGGYHVIAGILERGGLARNADEVWLFDALYGQTDSFVAWADRSGGRLVDIYTDHGGTREESQKLVARLRSRGTTVLAVEETALEADAIRGAGFVFIHTDLAHAEVADKRREFELFLRTSVLANR